MKEKLLARRYAKAAFEVALELGVIDQLESDFRMLSQLSKESRDLRDLLRSPVIQPHQKQKVFSTLLKDKVNQVTENFIGLLIKHGRERYLVEVADEIITLYRSAKEIVKVEIRSALPLSNQNKSELISRLQQQIGKQLEITEIIDPSLIGGFVIEYNDQQWDASLRNDIRKLRSEFDENLYVRQY